MLSCIILLAEHVHSQLCCHYSLHTSVRRAKSKDTYEEKGTRSSGECHEQVGPTITRVFGEMQGGATRVDLERNRGAGPRRP